MRRYELKYDNGNIYHIIDKYDLKNLKYTIVAVVDTNDLNNIDNAFQFRVNVIELMHTLVDQYNDNFNYYNQEMEKWLLPYFIP